MPEAKIGYKKNGGKMGSVDKILGFIKRNREDVFGYKNKELWRLARRERNDEEVCTFEGFFEF